MKVILIALLLTVFVSCKTIQRTNAESASIQNTADETSLEKPTSTDSNDNHNTAAILAANRGTTGADSDLTDPTSSNKNRNNNTTGTVTGTSETSGNIINQSSGSTGAASNVMMTSSGSESDVSMDFKKMYTDLKMTEVQIQQFQSAMRNYNPSEESDIEAEQNSKLEAILSEAQYEAYEKWKKSNPWK